MLSNSFLLSMASDDTMWERSEINDGKDYYSAIVCRFFTYLCIASHLHRPVQHSYFCP